MTSPVPDHVLDATGRILTAVLPVLQRTPGPVADPDGYARYRAVLRRLLADTRAAARSSTLAADIAAVVSGYRLASGDVRAVIAGLERVAVAARAVVPVSGGGVAARAQRDNEIALTILLEATALAEIGHAVASLTPRSHEEALRMRQRAIRAYDVAVERAADLGVPDVVRALRQTAAALARDLIERGRPLARIVAYQTAVPMPSVVLAHRLYQSAGRAGELHAENAAGTDHPAFMPMAGRAYSR